MKRYIVLSDGTVYEGMAFGSNKKSIGELVFTTGMCGYIETLTDPSYYGQIVMQTFPMIGNYGIIPHDFEGNCFFSGYVVSEWCEHPSNFRCEKDLDTYLCENDIPGVYGVDTRAITRHIREFGVMNAVITDNPKEALEETKSYVIKDAVKSVTTKESFTVKAENEQFKIALYDFGAKKNIIRELVKRGCTVHVLPSNTKAEDVLDMGVDGVMLSNGCGDPAENIEVIANIAKLMGKLPIFGICLGHQLMALATGAKTTKLKYGHRGVNQPCKNLNSGRTYITSQNHGYAVVSDSIKKGQLSFVNANDGTCEGIDYPEYTAFSVQFHPEACSGPHDTAFLFDKFIELLKGEK